MRPSERPAVWHNLGSHAPLVCSMRRQRLWIQQECFLSSCTGPKTPHGKDSVTRHNAAGEVWKIMKRHPLPRHNDVRQQGILGVDMETSFDRCDGRHTNVRQILENLNTLIVHLAPGIGVSLIAG